MIIIIYNEIDYNYGELDINIISTMRNKCCMFDLPFLAIAKISPFVFVLNKSNSNHNKRNSRLELE